MNKKGTILQIVLVLFIIMMGALSFRNFSLSLSMRTYQKIERLMKQKNIEIVLCQYYLYMLENDVLMDAEFEYGDYHIDYVYEDRGGYQLITTKVKFKDEGYQFLLKVKNDHSHVLEYVYKGG